VYAGPLATCAIPLLNVPDWVERKGRVEAQMGGGVSFEASMAIASVVGSGLVPEGLPRFLATHAEAEAQPRALSAGPLRIGATIASARLADVERALHAAFVR